MKIYVKRNKYTYEGETFINEVLLRVEDKCDCIHQVEHIVGPDADYFEGHEIDPNNSHVRAFLIGRQMQIDLDYDWDENPIERYSEELDYVPINYCPICGDEIEILIEEVVDLSEQVRPILEKLDALSKKRRSVKTADKIYELDKQLKKIVKS